MKYLVALLTLTWAASGQQAVQTLVGLPEYGVTLTGTVQEPVIQNNSAKTIIGHVIRKDYAGGGAFTSVNFSDRGTGGIPPGQFSTKRAVSRVVTAVNGVVQGVQRTQPFVAATLDAVVFADGEFVGPDTAHNFEQLSRRLAAEQEVAALVSAARNDPTKQTAAWAELDRIRTGSARSDFDQFQLVVDLLNSRSRRGAADAPDDREVSASGDAAAYDMADKVLAIPKLWRSKR